MQFVQCKLFFVVVVTKYKRRGGLALVVMLFDYATPFCFSVVVIVFALTLHQSIYYCLLIYNVQLSQFNVYFLIILGLFVFSFHCICLYQSTFLLQIFFSEHKKGGSACVVSIGLSLCRDFAIIDKIVR